MALKQHFNFRGINIEDAYFRVASFNGDKAAFGYEVSVHADPVAQPLASLLFHAPFNLDGGNIVQQAYEHLKTLPEFAGAVDC